MTTFEKFVEYFEGKTIALVGSAGSLLNSTYGEFIDKHDIVVRINRGVPYEQYKLHAGSRTDVWSYGMGERDDLRKKAHLATLDRKYSMYPWFDSKWVPNYLRELENNIILPKKFSIDASKQCGNQPATTGVDTLHFLATGTKYKSISIFGIDCYKSGYWFQSVDNSIDISQQTKDAMKKTKREHKVDLEFILINVLVEKYKNIKWYN
jgi:hypothetical protein